MVRHGADLARSFMRLPSRVSAAPALFVRVAVSLAALVSFVGDVLLRRLPLRAAFDNAAHLTAGTTFVALMYARVSGAAGAAALSADNIGAVALTTVMLPIIVNGTFYLELALGQTIAWVDARLTLRWESIVYLVS